MYPALTSLVVLVLATLLPTQRADAGCGCTKPPPPPAAVRPAVTFAGAPVTLFGASLESGKAYLTTFIPSGGGAPMTMPGTAITQKDLADGVAKPMLVTLLPSIALGPAAIEVRDGSSNALVMAVADDAFTVAPAPVAIPATYGTHDRPGYRAAVSRGGTVYMTFDLTHVTGPMVFDGQPLGYGLRFNADDLVFYNTQGILMQRLLTNALEPIPGMSVFPAANMTVDGDRLHYSRHEFASYFLQHQERQPHRVDSMNPNWHVDGTRHIDHNILIVAIMGALNDGALPAPGATPAFNLRLTTSSVFFKGLVGANSIGSGRNILVDSFSCGTTSSASANGKFAAMGGDMLLSPEITDGAPLSTVSASDGTTASGWDVYDVSPTPSSCSVTFGDDGDLFTNGVLSLSSGSTVRGDVEAGSFQLTRATISGTTTVVTAPTSFLGVEVPNGLPHLGALNVSTGTSHTIVGPGSFALSGLAVGRNATLMIDNSKGPVTLYVSGSVNIARDGQVVASNSDPEQFAIYVSTTDQVSLGADTSFYGVVYAPRAKLMLNGSGEFYGAFLGADVNLGAGSSVHYASSLKGQ